jgi:hypothetical protein
MLEYKGFLIEPFETEPGRWRAEITRPDGRKIKTLPDGQEQDFIRTSGAEAFWLRRRSSWPCGSSMAEE